MATIYYVDFLSKKLLSCQKEELKVQKERTQESFDKQAFFNRCLAIGKVAVSFSTSADNVSVPAAVLSRDVAVITFSTQFANPDVVTDDVGISQTLSFSGETFKVLLPWDAINSISLVSGALGREWLGGIPKDLPALKTSTITSPPDPA